MSSHRYKFPLQSATVYRSRVDNDLSSLILHSFLGFMKRLPFTSRKKITSGSATVHKISEHGSGGSPHRDGASLHSNTLPSRDSSPSTRNLKKVRLCFGPMFRNL